MSKYDSLTRYLDSARTKRVNMSFKDIEAVLGFPLPDSARKHRPWWSNESKGNHVQARAWTSAGFQVSEVDMAEEKLAFVQLNEVEREERTVHHPLWGAMKGTVTMGSEARIREGRRHPIFGAMKGMIHIPDDVDLTEPADPEWADLIDEKYGRQPGE